MAILEQIFKDQVIFVIENPYLSEPQSFHEWVMLYQWHLHQYLQAKINNCKSDKILLNELKDSPLSLLC